MVGLRRGVSKSDIRSVLDFSEELALLCMREQNLSAAKHAASSRPWSRCGIVYPENMYYSDNSSDTRLACKVPVTVRAAAHCRSRRRRAAPHPTSTTSRARDRGHQRLYIPWKVVKPHEFSVARNYLQYPMRLNILNTAPASYHDFAHCRILLHSPDSNSKHDSKSRQKTHDTHL